MTLSVNTNVGAMVALQNLNATNMALSQTQTRINTGLKISSAKDNGAIWAIAQNQRATISSLDSVKDSLNRGSSIIDVAMAAGQSISDLLTQMKAKALAASDTSLDTTSRAALNEDFKALRDQITTAVDNADFNGANLLKSSAPDLQSLANADGSSYLTAKAQDLSFGGGVITLSAASAFTSAAEALSLVSLVATSLIGVNSSLAKLGTASKLFDTHKTFVQSLQDSLQSGVGNLVDADMAKESATLQALQTKQQLGVQALGIANQAPQTILSLFR